MSDLRDSEDQSFTTVGRLSQAICGVFLLAVTLFADVYAVRDFVWIFEHVRSAYVEPLFSGAVLALTPWLALVSYRLMRGTYEHRGLFSPLALILLGVGLAIVGVLGWRSGFFEAREAYRVLFIAGGAISLGWYRARKWGFLHHAA